RRRRPKKSRGHDGRACAHHVPLFAARWYAPVRGHGRPTEGAGRPRQRAFSARRRSEEHTSELQSRGHLVCRLLLEKKKPNSASIRRSRIAPPPITKTPPPPSTAPLPPASPPQRLSLTPLSITSPHPPPATLPAPST